MDWSPCAPLKSLPITAINGFIASGLFKGQSKEFLNVIQQLAAEADAAVRR
jgi:hypothetical protein